MRQFHILLISLILLVGCSNPKETDEPQPLIGSPDPTYESPPPSASVVDGFYEPQCLVNTYTGECIADLPQFPWPIPKPSSYTTFRDNELTQISRNSLGELADSLEYLLEQSGYSEFTYYNMPKGIAMTAQLERIGKDGKPFPSPQRWDINDISISMMDFEFSRLLRILVGAEPGFYRVLVFIISDKNLVIQFDEAPDSEQQLVNMAESGAIALTEDIRAVAYADVFNLSVLVYEMERKRSGIEAVMYKSGLSAKEHLAYTDIQL